MKKSGGSGRSPTQSGSGKAGKSAAPASAKRAGQDGGRNKGPGEVRIIGGQWRGRRVPFSAVEGLRPTLDRYRETLFNWLMFDVEGAHCLDLFAGSGALGLEALSRGAQQVDFVDANPRVCNDLRANLQKLESDKGRVWHSSAETWLRTHRADLTTGTTGPYDLVFLDPPFHQDLLQGCIHLLETGGWLTPTAKVYLEAETGFDRSKLPYHWRVHREKDGGNKIFLLLLREPEHPLAPA